MSFPRSLIKVNLFYLYLVLQTTLRVAWVAHSPTWRQIFSLVEIARRGYFNEIGLKILYVI